MLLRKRPRGSVHRGDLAPSLPFLHRLVQERDPVDDLLARTQHPRRARGLIRVPPKRPRRRAFDRAHAFAHGAVDVRREQPRRARDHHLDAYVFHANLAHETFQLSQVTRDVPADVRGENLRVRLDEVDDVHVRQKHGELAHLRRQRARHVHPEHLRVPLDDLPQVDVRQEVAQEPQALDQKVRLEEQHLGEPPDAESDVDLRDADGAPQRILQLRHALHHPSRVAEQAALPALAHQRRAVRRARDAARQPERVQRALLRRRELHASARRGLRVDVHLVHHLRHAFEQRVGLVLVVGEI
mmetsp:Transcript_1484/g.4956  ORF Transcript_1484/g.4956 Transcript_1484/m.4956 type:complete len:299 (+) Transcript_1484:769-1665(+)